MKCLRKMLLSGVVVASLLGASSIANAEAITDTQMYNKDLDFTYTDYNTNIQYQVEGKKQAITHIIEDINGGYMIEYHQNYQGYTITNLTDGTKYQLVNISNSTYHVDDLNNATVTVVETLKTMSQGTTPIRTLHVIYKETYENGVWTEQLDKITSD